MEGRNKTLLFTHTYACCVSMPFLFFLDQVCTY